MKRIPVRVWLVLIFLVLLPTPGRAAQAVPLAGTSQALVYLVAPKTQMAVSEILMVEMWVADVNALYGADIQISFDPSAFQVLDANPELPGVQITLRSDLLQPMMVIHCEADNTLGRIWYANVMLNPAEPAYGSGALFEFEMTALKDGVYPFQFSNFQLSTNGGEPIPVEAQTTLFIVGYPLFLPLILRGT